jgi:hypothetical protein
MEEQSYADQMITALNTFYENEVVDLVDQKLQLFHSFTYGEMMIATLLLILIVLYVLKWVYEVIR